MFRSIATRPTAELGGRGSVLVLQRHDHARLDELLQRAVARRGAAQQRALRELARLAFAHAFAEEAVLWPLCRRALPDGEQLTLRIEQEHQELEAAWGRIEQEPAGSPHRQQLIEQFADLLRRDARDEEQVLFPRLREQLDDPQLRKAGLRWGAVRWLAPTRPHPTTGRRPPGTVLSALPLTVLDRTRDRLEGAGGGRGRAARAAATVAGFVEETPGPPA